MGVGRRVGEDWPPGWYQMFLTVPGPNPIGIWRTIGVGLVGAFIGGLLGGLLGLGTFSILFELAISAGLVYYISGRQRSLNPSGRR